MTSPATRMLANARTLTVVVAAASFVSGASSAIGQASAASPQASQSPSEGSLGQVMAFTPAGTTTIGFTDWSSIRAAAGAQDVTGASPIDDQLKVVLTTGTTEAAGSGFALNDFRDHAANWGWNALDLDWEATFGTDGAPVFVLRFRDGFDPAPVKAHFDERGFTSEPLDGGVLRSHEMDVDDDWLTTTEFAILNTVFLADGRTLVLSADPDRVRTVLDGLDTPQASSAGGAVAHVLDGASAAFLALDPAICFGFDPRPLPGMSDAQRLVVEELLSEVGTLSPYSAMGVGYSRSWDAIGKIAFAYDDEETAAADLPGRRRLAEDGLSSRTGQPYAGAVFAVADAAVDGSVMSLDVDPVDDQPRRLFQMAYARDMLFAVCSTA
jgi:hypothetical protein